MEASGGQGEAPCTMEDYLTRGAMLVCSCGTHKRRLNLPVCHGEQIDKGDGYRHPMVHEGDCEFGEDKNIGSFGICTGDGSKGEETVVLKKYTPYGNKQSEEIMEGPKCIPLLEEAWKDVKEDAFLMDGIPRKAATMKSYVICSKGGIIRPETSGMEYKGEQDG